MSRMAALPFVSLLSQSANASDRATFIRIFYDFARHRGDLARPIPDDWRHAIACCLANAESKERGDYFVALTEIGVSEGLGADNPDPIFTRSRGDVSHPSTSQTALVCLNPTPASHEDTEDIEAVLRNGSIEEILAFLSEKPGQLDPRLTTIVVNRARSVLDFDKDPRLCEAILALRPPRIETAPLFLQANVAQRWAIVLAAQRAELGRRGNAAIATVAREIINQLEYAAIADDASDFSDLLGRAIGASPRLATRIAEDLTGEPLAIALIAIAAPNDVCVRILTARDMHDRGRFQRILPLTRLSRSLSPAAARRIVSAIVGPSGAAEPDATGSFRLSSPRQYNLRTRRIESVSIKSKWPYPRNVNAVGAK